MTYEYRFDDEEGGTTEVWQSMKDDALKEIDGRPVTRIVTGGSGVVFKEGSVPWPDREHNNKYTRVHHKADGTLGVSK